MTGVAIEKLSIPMCMDGIKFSDASRKVEISPSEDINNHLYRLPRHFAPVRYELEFQPDLENHSFRANEVIQIESCGTSFLEAGEKGDSSWELRQRRLVLHSIELKIRHEDVFIVLEDDRVLRCIDIVSHPGTSETLEFYFDRVLPQEAGQRFAFHISCYEGFIHTELVSQGLFHSNKLDPGFLSTQLEPTNARKLYPCFDEPSFKAIFRLAVAVDLGYMVVSNTPLVQKEELCAELAPSRSRGAFYPLSSPRWTGKSHPSVEGSDGGSDCIEHTSDSSVSTDIQTSVHFCRFIFEETPPIHTCIVGFNVGKFSILERYCPRLGILYRVVFPCDRPVSSARYALNLLNMAVYFFDSFFDLRLGLKKIDLVALESFQSLGMENWGMINILMEYLLVNDTTPLERRQRIARLVGHEVCHHWFGNWLSIEWWNDIWLKEGMCRLLEYHFVDAFFPDWHMWDDFVGAIANVALAEDAVAARMHPLGHCDARPRSVSNSFDTIGYGKGAMLLRMLFSLVGVPTLRRALTLLLRRHANGCVDLGTFKAALAEVHDDPLDGRFRMVVERVVGLVGCAGHPYVLVERRGVGAYRVSQYAMPPLWRGVLPEWVRRQRRRCSAVADLSTLPTGTTFEWDPRRLLRHLTDVGSFASPILVLEVSRGDSSVYELFVDRNDVEYRVHKGTSPAEDAPSQGSLDDSGFCYFNYGATGLLRYDYDLASWRQIFKRAAFLHSEDHITITGTLSALRNVLVGRFPHEIDGDRCTLMLEWLSILTASTQMMNSFLWDYITDCLEELVFLVHGHDCSQAVHHFVEDLYAPLFQRRLVSFFARESPLNFHALHHISRTTVNKMLFVLALCGSSSLLEEAAEMGLSVLDELGQRNLAESMPFIAATSARSSRRMDFMDSGQVESATIALLWLTFHDPAQWWGCVAGIVAGFCPFNTLLSDKSAHLSIPKITITRHDAMKVLPVVLPAFFSMVDDRAFDFMTNVLNMFNNVPKIVAQTLLWNTRFLAHFLSHRGIALKPFVVESLGFIAAKFCSNSHVIALFYACLTHQNKTMAELALFQALLLDEEEKGEETAATVRVGEDGGHLSPNMLENFSAMTVNCVWIAYCCTHIEQFLCRRPGRSA